MYFQVLGNFAALLSDTGAVSSCFIKGTGRMTLEELIDEAIESIPEGRNRELALFYFPPKGQRFAIWRAAAANMCPQVCLGEGPGEFHGEGLTAVGAIEALIAAIRASGRTSDLAHADGCHLSNDRIDPAAYEPAPR
jgi:hypothetical protein